MLFLKNRWKWICGIFAVFIFLCGSSVMWISFQETEDEGEAVALADKAIPVISDAVIPDEPIDTEEEETSETDPLAQFSTDDWRLILINKRHRVPDDYSFETGYVDTSKGKMPCDKRIANHLSDMINDAKEAGIKLIIVSPYRSVAHQKYLFNRKLKSYMNQGESYLSSYYQTAQTVTIPGSSEHQIGLALDITSEKYYSLNEGFGESDAGLWLSENCWKYGFVVRYPMGKEDITGIEYEPWHFRYVGKDAACYMTEQSLCLEEFLELLEERDK